jgi:polyisoprenoid-binding protein YceI
MNKIKIIVLSLFVFSIIVPASGLTQCVSTCQKTQVKSALKVKQNPNINMSVSHGHCSLPFAGIVDNLNIITTEREGQGNPLEGMSISFDINPNSFNVCANDGLTERIKTPGLFLGDNNEKITFTSTDVYTMGLDWYQVNGQFSIKGVTKDVKFFVTGIRDPKETMPTSLVLKGELNLFDWGIDFDKIVNGKSDPVPTKTLYINMQIEMT